VLLPITDVTTLNVVLKLPCMETSGRVAELERPQEVVGLFEVGADGDNLVDQILNADNTVLAEVVFNEGVIAEGNTLAVDLAVSALVDELTDRLEVRRTIGNERLDDFQHLRGRASKLDKDTVVDLEKTEKLQDLAWLGSKLVDTLDADHKDKLRLRSDMEGAFLLGNPRKTDVLTLGIAILLHVLLSTLEDDGTLLLGRLLLFISLGGTLLAGLLLALPLLEESLRDHDMVVGRHGTVGQISFTKRTNFKMDVEGSARRDLTHRFSR